MEVKVIWTTANYMCLSGEAQIDQRHPQTLPRSRNRVTESETISHERRQDLATCVAKQ